MTVTQKTINAVKKRANNSCEVCGKISGLDIHHCLYHRSKSKPELDTKENLELLCKEHHELANSFDHRIAFYARQVKYYGREHMETWHADLPLKVKVNF